MALLTPDLGFIFWHSVIFLLSLLILSRYAWSPILKAIRKREKAYEKAMVEMKKAQEEVRVLDAKKEEIMTEAHRNSDLILQKAIESKDALLKEAAEEALHAKEKIMDHAHQLITLERAAVRAAMKRQTVALVLHTTEKLIAQKLEASPEQERLIKQMMSDVEETQNPD